MSSVSTVSTQTPCEGARNSSEKIMGSIFSKRTDGKGDDTNHQEHITSASPTLFNFSDCCNECSIEKDNLKFSISIYCLNCFHVKNNKDCPPECDCNMFESFTKTMISEVRRILWKKICQKRANEYFISEKRVIKEKIHGTTIETTITMSKQFKTDKNDNEKVHFLNNCMRIECIGADKNVDVIVQIKDDYISCAVGVFIKENSSIEKQFVKDLEENLESSGLIVTRVEDCMQYLQNKDGPLFVACLRGTRLKSDVKYTLDGIKEELFGRIILVVVHCKIDDTDCMADVLKRDYSDLRIIDYFQQEEINNLGDVLKSVKDIIFND